MKFSIGNHHYNMNDSSRLTATDVIIIDTCSLEHPRTRRCCFCKYGSKSKKSARCKECLLTDDLNGFVVDDHVAENEMYQSLKEVENEIR